MVKKCTCKHEYQDAKYGEGMRVHNPYPDKLTKKTEWRCSVCGNPRRSSGAQHNQPWRRYGL